MSATTQAAATEVCQGENLAIILALYWVVYLLINAVIFAAIMYALRKCFDKVKLPGGGGGGGGNEKNKDGTDSPRPESQISLISRGKK